MRNAWLLVVVVTVLALNAGAEELLRVSEPGTQPPDARIAKPRDYNATWAWTSEYKDKAEWEKRAKEVREQILISQGLHPLPEKTPLKPVIHGKIDRDDYTIEKVFFQSFPGHYVTGNLYRPKGKTGKLPAVLCPHGHWNNGRFYETNDAEAKKEITSGAEKTMEGAKYPLQARAAMLARMGCVVFFYDMVGYADSKPIEHRKGFTDLEAELHLQNFMGLQTWNSIRVLDFVSSLEDVDPARIAVTGASGGGTQTMILAAIDPRVAVAVPAVMVSQNMQGGCICENSSLLRVHTNNIEFAACYAPKPQGMTGANDWTKDIETAGLPSLKAIYGLYDAGDLVAAWYRPFPHNYNQVSRELMYNWLNKHLKLGHTEPIVEKPFVPVPPRALSVWDEKNPLPADAASAEVLKKTWHDLSDKQLNHMITSDPQEYRRLLTAMLRVMVNDRWPATVQVVEASKKESKIDAIAVERGLLTRPGENSALPYAMMTPAEWNGETVVWVHPAGKLTLTDEHGKPLAPVQRILDAKYAVLCGDLYGTGEFLLPEMEKIDPESKAKVKVPAQTATDLRPVHKDFAAYTFGYNRTILAERVHDIVTLVAYAKTIKQSKFVHQVCWEGAGLWGLLAKGVCGEAILRSAIDLNGFDFDQVKDFKDENFLPGALKYGGVMTFVSLCRVGETALWRAPEGREQPLPSRGVREGRGRQVDWVIRQGAVDLEEVPRR